MLKYLGFVFSSVGTTEKNEFFFFIDANMHFFEVANRKYFPISTCNFHLTSYPIRY